MCTSVCAHWSFSCLCSLHSPANHISLRLLCQQVPGRISLCSVLCQCHPGFVPLAPASNTNPPHPESRQGEPFLQDYQLYRLQQGFQRLSQAYQVTRSNVLSERTTSRELRGGGGGSELTGEVSTEPRRKSKGSTATWKIKRGSILSRQTHILPQQPHLADTAGATPGTSQGGTYLRSHSLHHPHCRPGVWPHTQA